MAPPYKFVDEATNETIWSGIDVPAGHSMAIFDTDTSGRVSPNNFLRPADGTTPPVTDPPPVTPPIVGTPNDNPDPPSTPPVTVTGGWFHPASMAELLAQIQSSCDNGKLLILDPNVRINSDINGPLALKDVGGAPHGVDFNGAQVSWTGDGDPNKSMFNLDLPGPQNRSFVFKNGYFYGGGFAGTRAGGPLVKMRTSGGGGLFLHRFDNLVMEWGSSGLDVQGNIFEFLTDVPNIKDMTGSLITFGHANGVFSNAIVRNPFLSRSPGCGIELMPFCNSVMVQGGSFISLDGGGIKCLNGIKYLGGGADFENCGKNGIAAVEAGTSQWGTTIDGISCENTAGQTPIAVRYHPQADTTVENVRTVLCANALI